jgi:hypothetical protein
MASINGVESLIDRGDRMMTPFIRCSSVLFQGPILGEMLKSITVRSRLIHVPNDVGGRGLGRYAGR